MRERRTKGAASVGESRAAARRRSERRRSSSASDDDGRGFQARCVSGEQKGPRASANRAPPHGEGASGGVLPLRVTTTAADSKRDARAANKRGRESAATSWYSWGRWCKIRSTRSDAWPA